ncbi:MAG: exported protein of unknown function [Caulobacter sp.]|nr:exported protein of unknown function [Caulobacter sp.]
MSKLIASGRNAAALIVCASVLTACATASEDVAPTFQPAAVYENMTCEQIAKEVADVSQRAAEVAGKQDRKRQMDQAATGVGVLVFWPALFLLATPGHKRELGELKGKYEALNRAAETKHCKL